MAVRATAGPEGPAAIPVSALLRAADDTDEQEDPGAQNRFTALRRFEILTCSGLCTDDGDFQSRFISPADAFPGGVPRPLAPDVILRGFDVPDTEADVSALAAAVGYKPSVGVEEGVSRFVAWYREYYAA